MMALLAHPVRSFRRYYKMFIPFMIGWIGGFLLLTCGLVLLFEIFPDVAMALFAGLIYGTVPGLINKSYDKNPSQG